MKKETSPKNPDAAAETKTGRYAYDKKLGKVVKISDEIVGIKKGTSSGGTCPVNPGGHSCGGGCCCGG